MDTTISLFICMTYDKVLKRTEKFKLKEQKDYNHRLFQQFKGEVTDR